MGLFLVKERKILLSYKHTRWKRPKREQMESLSFHKKMKDGRCCYSSKWKVWRRTAGKREACVYCERKRSGRKEKESHIALLVRISPRRN